MASATPSPDPAVREQFPRASRDTYLNAAGLMPLASFSAAGLERYLAFQSLGPDEGRNAYIGEMWSGIRGLWADLVGVDADEVGLVSCTKAGEQIALDAVDDIKPGGNIVTNDLHFSGSLHNLVGLRQAGRDVRIVKSQDWRVSSEDMAAAIDDNTALVTLSLVSNINGHLADLREIARIAHAHGALVYADIIQAAGIVPVDLHALDVDLAACSGYKWLYGVYGSGFVYVRKALQGKRLPDKLFPGRVKLTYEPWTKDIPGDRDEFEIHPQQDASRYEPGHVNYMGYCAIYEGLQWLQKVGVESALHHSVALNKRLKEHLDPDRYTCISPHLDRTPIITFLANNPVGIRERLAAANITVSLSANRIRVSTAPFNNEADIDALVKVLNAKA